MNDWGSPPLTPRQRDVQFAHAHGLWRGIRYGLVFALVIWLAFGLAIWWACRP